MDKKKEMLDTQIERYASEIVDSCMAIHKTPGPGLLESVYEKSLCVELKERDVPYQSQVEIPVNYKNCNVGIFRADIIVDKSIVIELKSVERDDPLFKAQLLSYMKLGNYPLGFLINFNKTLIKDGIKRMILRIDKNC